MNNYARGSQSDAASIATIFGMSSASALMTALLLFAVI